MIVGAVGQLMQIEEAAAETGMYLGGEFTTVDGTTRNRAAAVDEDTSTTDLLAWNPNCAHTVRCMVLNGDDLYLSGSFTTVRGTARNYAAAVDSDPSQASPTLRAWDPDCGGGSVRCMVLNGDDMYLGGAFTTVRGSTRNRAAAVDSDTSQASPALREWNPNCNNTVRTMVLNGDDMYLGGWFTTVRGSTRNRTAAVDSDSSQASPALRAWNPNCASTVRCMVLNGDDMYLGGNFTTVRGTARNYAAAVDSDPSQASPALRAWNPDCSGYVCTMVLNGDDMYLGGNFTTVRGSTRNRAAAVDSDSSQATPTLRAWNPNCNSTIFVMILNGDDMYLGGYFTTVRGSTRTCASAVDSDSSQASPALRAWNPNCSGDYVYTMVLSP